METFIGIMIPFLGTALGAACVFFMKKSLSDLVRRSLAGFAAGVMVAASIWSLLIPAIEQSEGMGKLSFLPAFIGFWVGVLFLLLLDRLIPHLHVGSKQAEGPKSRLGRTTMMVLAVTLHNIPEGMAVGVMYAGFLAGNAQITAASALVLSLGIAIQNFPEGAIISMPLRAEGESKGKAFLGGVLSGVVEPIGAVLTLLAAQLVIPALPYFLSFAAGAMLYVVVEELIPEMSQGKHTAEKRSALAFPLRPERHGDDRTLGKILNGNAKRQDKRTRRRDLRVSRKKAGIHHAHRHAFGNVMQCHRKHHHSGAPEIAFRSLRLVAPHMKMGDKSVEQEQKQHSDPKSDKGGEEGQLAHIFRLLYRRNQQTPNRCRNHNPCGKARERTLYRNTE